jgi:hypothetical protein
MTSWLNWALRRQNADHKQAATEHALLHSMHDSPLRNAGEDGKTLRSYPVPGSLGFLLGPTWDEAWQILLIAAAGYLLHHRDNECFSVLTADGPQVMPAASQLKLE